MTLRQLGLVGLLGLLIAASPAPPADQGIELTYLNQTYSDLEADLAPIQEGPLAIQLSSPSQQLTLHRNRLVLTANPGGAPDAWVEAEFEGEGDLVADIEGGTLTTQLRDRVVVPRQTVQKRGKVRIERDEESYLLHVLEAPPSVPVQIRSDLVGRLVGICKGMGLFAVVDCVRFERALSTVNIPIRSDGQTVLRLPHARLSAADRAYLDRFAAP